MTLWVPNTLNNPVSLNSRRLLVLSASEAGFAVEAEGALRSPV